MNETKKAGMVTQLCRAAEVFAEFEVESGSNDADAKALADAIVAVEAPGCAEEPMALLSAFDLVASWPPELREVVPLIEALTPEGQALLPDVLRGLSAKGMPALVEAQVGAVSTAAKAAEWAGKLDEADARMVLDAIREHGRARRQAGEDAMADACVQMGVELQGALGLEDVSVEGARLAAPRMPRRQLKGTCPQVEAGQKRELAGWGESVRVWTVERPAELSGDWACSMDGLQGLASIDELRLASAPLAEDFEPIGPKPEPRVWKAGTVPPRLVRGMKLWRENGTLSRILDAPTGCAWCVASPGEAAVRVDRALTWKLAQDFPVPEDA